jgi:ABC-2 type transport system permease protein
MILTALAAMVRKDLAVFLADRRAVVMAFAAPIAIASFFGGMFPGPGGGAGGGEPMRVAIHVVDEDNSAIAKAIVAGLQADPSLRVTRAPASEAWDAVRRGRSAVAVSIPRGFGENAGRAFYGSEDRPRLDLVYDPSRATELAMVRGILAEHVMRAVTQEVAGLRYRRPYEVREQALTARANAGYNGYAHSFAGMGVQFLLFAAVDLGVGVLLERQRGLWKRLRSAPLSRRVLLTGKAASGTLITLLTLLVSFAFAMLVFGVRIEGSVAGFLAVAVACALMAATFGLFLAALGHTPSTTRGVASLVVLIMVMLGGAWVPTFVFPAWLQQLTVVVPTRWAVDGLDAMTWRGLGFDAAVTPVAVLLGYALLFGWLAVSRFRWEEA